MDYKHIRFSSHAIRQMFHRSLKKDDVLTVTKDGLVIVDYPDDKPYPSCLILGFVDDGPIHVVFALDKENQIGIIVTVYVPDPQLWTEDFKSRRNES